MGGQFLTSNRFASLRMLLALAAVACSEQTPTAPAKVPAEAGGAASGAMGTLGCMELAISEAEFPVGLQRQLRFSTKGFRGRGVSFRSSNPGIATVDASGIVTARNVGRAIVFATSLQCRDSVVANVVAAQDASTPPPPPPPAGAVRDSVVLTVVRFSGADDSATVSSGIPLKKGALVPSQLGTVRLLLNGIEVPIAIRPLSGVHANGGLRSVHIQFRAFVRSAGTRAVLQWGAVPATARRSINTALLPTNVAALPVDPNYLIATELFGKTIPVSSSTEPKYESHFRQLAEDRWAADGADWGLSNYYDRALNHLVYWGRSGDAKYWNRAMAIARDYRLRYLEANDYLPAPHWMQLEGIALHYWLTGDESSRIAVTRVAGRMTSSFTPAVVGPGGEWREGRIVQRMLLASMLSHELADSSRDWRLVASQYKNAAISAQNADGSYSYPGGWSGGQGNFMVGLVNGTLIQYYERISPDADIVSSVRKSADYLWSTQWVYTSNAFKFASKPLPPSGDGFPWDTPSPDLNMLIVNSFAWLGFQLRDTQYRDRAQLIAYGAIEGAWLGGSKQFNQQYYDSHHYLFYKNF